MKKKPITKILKSKECLKNTKERISAKKAKKTFLSILIILHLTLWSFWFRFRRNFIFSLFLLCQLPELPCMITNISIMFSFCRIISYNIKYIIEQTVFLISIIFSNNNKYLSYFPDIKPDKKK